MQGDFSRNNKTIEEKINEGVSLLVERENKFKGRFRSRRPRDFFYANEEEEEESDQSKSEDELGFIAIKEDDLDKEIKE